ncbi:MAG: RDD family protein [Acidobacteria bacterium]|nr:RDD family protein [Acidobacteriota bacterium]
MSPGTAAQQAQIERTLFYPRPAESATPEKKIVTFQKANDLLNKPASKKTSAPETGILEKNPGRILDNRRTVRKVPQQRELKLEPPKVITHEPGLPKLEPQIEEVSREVLFSRMLAGMVDLLLPLLLSSLFLVSAGVFLRFDIFSPEALRLGIVLVAAFYFFNSIFFFLTTGQTPGMTLTDLHLIGDRKPGDISLPALLIRVCVFPLAAASVVGLVLGLFDPLRRCLHDRASHTRVVPSGLLPTNGSISSKN